MRFVFVVAVVLGASASSGCRRAAVSAPAVGGAALAAAPPSALPVVPASFVGVVRQRLGERRLRVERIEGAAAVASGPRGVREAEVTLRPDARVFTRGGEQVPASVLRPGMRVRLWFVGVATRRGDVLEASASTLVVDAGQE